MKWIKKYDDGSFGGRACAGTNAYISEDGTMIIIKFNRYFANKTPWMLREFRNGDLYYLDRDIMENRGYSTLREAQADAEEYIKMKNNAKEV